MTHVPRLDSQGRTIWIADAHRDDGKRFVVRADEKLTAFVEPESAIRAAGWQSAQKGWPSLAIRILWYAEHMDNEGQVRELLLKEYVEGGHAARQHEQLTRVLVSVFLPIFLALAAFVVGSAVSNRTKAVLAVGGFVVSLLVLNIVRRHQLYYQSYIKRARDIEATIKVQDAQVIKLYTLGRDATRGSLTVSNKTAFLVMFVFSATFFLVYFIHIICTIRANYH